MRVSAAEIRAARAARPVKVEIGRGVAEISANQQDRGLGFWAKCRSFLEEKLFHSPVSREAVLAEAQRYARDVLRAGTVRILD